MQQFLQPLTSEKKQEHGTNGSGEELQEGQIGALQLLPKEREPL